jgi:hypothetical protein
MHLRRLTAGDVTFAIQAEPEDVPYVGNCSAIDPESDRQAEEWIRTELRSGNEWAWCRVVVIASWEEFEGAASLGGCSYSSEAEFRDGGYLKDLKAEALLDLNREVGRLNLTLSKLEMEVLS